MSPGQACVRYSEPGLANFAHRKSLLRKEDFNRAPEMV